MPGAKTSRRMFPYSLGLFFLALVLLVLGYSSATAVALPAWPVLFLFFVGALLFIVAGYQSANHGYISFDRVSQVAIILIFSPWHAAVINGAASLLFPWVRHLGSSRPLLYRLDASLFNAGLMALMILGGGWAYRAVGGAIPLHEMSWAAVLPLLVLVLVMQIINESGMVAFQWIKDRMGVRQQLNLFSSLLEMGSAIMAVLVALVYNSGRMDIFLVLVITLGAGIYMMKLYARIRDQLEQLVETRTRELARKNRALEELATHDHLTGLHNRRFANEFLAATHNNWRRHGHAFVIAMLDIDYFKQINDRYSHAAGDEVLVNMGRLLQESVRDADMVARYGGEEFLLCFTSTGKEDATRIAEELRSLIEREKWEELRPGLCIQVSIGVVSCDETSAVEEMLKVADRRMYLAKNRGRNQVVAAG